VLDIESSQHIVDSLLHFIFRAFSEPSLSSKACAVALKVVRMTLKDTVRVEVSFLVIIIPNQGH